ncbi:MAG: phospholipid phosphatase, partial [Dermacoccus nishinomiyaensis]
MTTAHPDHHDGGREASARPTPKEVLASILKRAVLPALVAFGVLVAIGKIIMNVFDEIPAEDTLSRDVAGWRTASLNPISKTVSTINDTWFTIGGSVVVALVILVLTRKWWLAILPVLAISLEASVFVPVTKIVNRPRPEVERLDPHAPPTSSFPSGHTAASFALFWSIMLLAQRIPNVLARRIVQVVCFVFPFCVGFARLYRGMHHLSDVIIGALLGMLCA